MLEQPRNRALSKASDGCSSRRPIRASSSDRRTSCSRPSSASSRKEQPARGADLGTRTVAAANNPLGAGSGFDNHVLHNLIKPGELSCLSDRRADEHQSGRQDHQGPSARASRRTSFRDGYLSLRSSVEALALTIPRLKPHLTPLIESYSSREWQCWGSRHANGWGIG